MSSKHTWAGMVRMVTMFAAHFTKDVSQERFHLIFFCHTDRSSASRKLKKRNDDDDDFHHRRRRRRRRHHHHHQNNNKIILCCP